jgi:hypothetical protein
MARLAIGALFGVAIGLVVGAALDISAEPDERTVALAAEAGVDPVDLLGAANTVAVDPRQYLYLSGELAPPPPQPPPYAPVAPSISGAVARADCIIRKESGGLDVPNRQGSGARGPGQYMPSTWARHSAMYRQATGYAGSLSLHSLQDVRRVMAWILAAHPSTRREWVVGGC